MMTNCFSVMAASCPGWALTVAAVALTSLLERREDAQHLQAAGNERCTT